MNYLNELKKVANIKENDENPFNILFNWISELDESPTIEDIYKLAETHDFIKADLENYIYEMIYSFLGAGKSKKFNGRYNEEQLNMGIKVEYEHTTSSLLSERIAKDHLAEIPDYYTRLKEMEDEAKRT